MSWEHSWDHLEKVRKSSKIFEKVVLLGPVDHLRSIVQLGPGPGRAWAGPGPGPGQARAGPGSFFFFFCIFQNPISVKKTKSSLP